MSGKKISRLNLAERPVDVAHARYVPEIPLVLEVIKRRKLAELEMARLTEQAVAAFDRLTQRIGDSPAGNCQVMLQVQDTDFCDKVVPSSSIVSFRSPAKRKIAREWVGNR
jgi:hypothetical protein